MIRVYTWPDVQTAVNPYLRLFYRALEPWQVKVVGRVPLDNAVLQRHHDEVDVLHLHWGPDLLWRNRGPGHLRRLHGLIGLARLLGLARDLGKRIVWTIHDIESHDGSDFLDRRGYRLLAARADLCLCHDEDSQRQSVRRMGCRLERSMVVPHINFDGAFPTPGDRHATLANVGLDPQKRTLLCFGIARPYKGYELAIEALRRLPANYQLLIAGGVLDPAYGDVLRAAAGAEPRVRLVLRELNEQEAANYLHACDCVLLPYRRITGSGVLLSAFSMARGVVASDLPCFRASLAGDPDAGVLFRSGDAADLAAAVERYIAAPLAVRHAAARHVADRHAPGKAVAPFGEWLQRQFPERVERPDPAVAIGGH
jgi:beta-1,4-mannosyltransferase